MPEIPSERIKAFREFTFRMTPTLRVRSLDEAVAFVNERGFIFFWPIKALEFPSLWTAAAGNRPVPQERDDPGQITWEWKDDALGKGLWYYGRLLRHRNMMVSLECLPYFYALSPNYGDPENDFLEQYHQGTISMEARAVYETLLNQGAMDSLSLRREAHLRSTGSEGRFNHAIDTLQGELKILPVGISQAGSWHYAYIYDLVTRHFPELQDLARPISETEARSHLLLTCLETLGAAEISEISRLFGWEPPFLQKAIDTLVISGRVKAECTVAGRNNPWISLTSII